MRSDNWEKGPRPSREGPGEVTMAAYPVAITTEEAVGRWWEILVMVIDVVEEVVVCFNNNNDNKLYLHDHNKILQYMQKLLEINHWFLVN